MAAGIHDLQGKSGLLSNEIKGFFAALKNFFEKHLTLYQLQTL